MAVKYEFDYEEVEKLISKITELGGSSEQVLNEVLAKEAKETFEPSITGLIPMSGKKSGKHAATSKWSKIENGNLEFTIKARGGAANKPGSFGYLVFPNEGRGKRNPREQRFFEKGRDLQLPHLVEVTQLELLNKLEEVL